jgi:hypothetical protein
MSSAEIFRTYLQRFTSGDTAGAGSIPMAEWNSFRDGKLASARLIFDTAAMAALMPGS